LVADVSTNRRHLQSFTRLKIQLYSILKLISLQPEYHAWCKTNDFESKLEEDVKARQQEHTDELKKKLLKQQTIGPHLREKPAQPAPYTDELLLDAAIKWLIATDQVSHIVLILLPLMHPKFKEMIDIAARATQGINLPNHDQTHEAIIKLFHDQMTKLKIRLHVRILRY
ncbi:hypothetical protein B0H10DRAFT_1838579, partial [Mycena sp. CBHHK59/15]